MKGVQIRSDIMYARVAMRIPARVFVRKFEAAARGEQNELSEYVKPWNGRPSQSEWAEIRKRIFARDDYICTYCKARGGRLECDHIVPVAKGGNHEDENLTTSCFPCNRSKRDKTVEEWRRCA